MRKHWTENKKPLPSWDFRGTEDGSRRTDKKERPDAANAVIPRSAGVSKAKRTARRNILRTDERDARRKARQRMNC